MKKYLVLAALLISTPCFAQADRGIGSRGPGYATSSKPGLVKLGDTLAISSTGVLKTPFLTTQNVKEFGAACDGVRLTDATATGNMISSASYNFTSADVGKRIGVLGAGPLFALTATVNHAQAWNTVIASASGGVAYATSTATTNVTGAEAIFGSDDTAKFQDAVDKINAGGGGTLVIPSLICVTSTAILGKDNVSFTGEHKTKSELVWISASHMASAMFQGLAATATSAPYTGINFSNFTMNGYYAVQTSYTVEGKAIYFRYMDNPTIQNVVVKGFPATGIGPDYLFGGTIAQNTVIENGRLNTSGGIRGAGLGGAGIGVAVKGSDNSEEKLVISGNIAIANGSFNIFVEGYQDPAQSTIIKDNIIYISATHGIGIGETGGYQSIIANNKIRVRGTTAVSSPTGQGAAIALRKGTTTNSRAGLMALVEGNQILKVRDGILIDNTATGTTWATSFSVQADILNNVIKDVSRYCVLSKSESSYGPIVGLRLKNNKFHSCTTYGNYIMGSYGYTALDISGNEYRSAGTNAIYIEAPVDVFHSSNNLFYDTATSPTMGYGYTINDAAVTNGNIKNNLFNNVATPYRTAGTGSFAGIIQDNPGYNPIGASAVAVTASPMTYTAGTSPETLYVRGGTVESILVNSATVAESSPATIELPPNVAAIINFSATPSLVTYKH